MTKQEFLKRCETIYDMGMFKDQSVSVMLRNATEFYLRMRHVFSVYPEYFDLIKKDHQGGIAVDQCLIYALEKGKTLAADEDVYKAEILAHILDHPSQKCSEDKNAWHTRYGFCSH